MKISSNNEKSLLLYAEYTLEEYYPTMDSKAVVMIYFYQTSKLVQFL